MSIITPEGASIVAPELLPHTPVQELDAVVVGAGVLGLVTAKQLVDLGQRVAVVEKSAAVADGPSTKNHGWIHTGIVHSLSVADPTQGRDVVRKLQYGHRYFTGYAPECLDEPFEPAYAIARDADLAQRARDNWTRFGVPHRELTADEFFEVEAGLNPEKAGAFFEHGDARINNRLLFAKLLADIKRGGGRLITNASYEYEDANTITVTSAERRARLRAPLFFYTTGIGLDDSYQKLTGNSLGIQYWKSHLLLMRRFTSASVISLDRDTPIIINHGELSVTNRSYDEVPQEHTECHVDRSEVRKAFDVLTSYFPHAKDHADDVHAIACLKPNIPTSSAAARHNVSEAIYEPKPGHLFALPGKMTEAPFVAATLVRRVASLLRLGAFTERPIDVVEGMTRKELHVPLALAEEV